MPVAIHREAGECDDVFFVVVANDDAVEFDRCEPGGLSGFDAGPDLLERAEAHDTFESDRVQRVHMNVDPPESCVVERFGEAGQKDCVRGHPDVGNALDLMKTIYDLYGVLSQEGFATGEANLVEPDLGCGSYDLFDFRSG